MKLSPRVGIALAFVCSGLWTIVYIPDNAAEGWFFVGLGCLMLALFGYQSLKEKGLISGKNRIN
jgi:hypothetical protein